MTITPFQFIEARYKQHCDAMNNIECTLTHPGIKPHSRYVLQASKQQLQIQAIECATILALLRALEPNDK